MKTLRRILIALCAILFAASTRADVLIPGTRPIEHTFVIEDSPLLASYDLVAFPVRGIGGAERIVPGTAFATAKAYYGTKVYALAKGTELPENADDKWFADKLCATIPVQKIDAVPKSSMTTAIRTTLAVRALSLEGFTLEAADEQRERDGKTLLLIAGAVSAGLIGLLVVRRMRRD